MCEYFVTFSRKFEIFIKSLPLRFLHKHDLCDEIALDSALSHSLIKIPFEVCFKYLQEENG